MDTTNSISLKDTTANPAPLGLLGFGMTTILLNIHNAGFYGLNSMIIGMGIFMGGFAQIVAGIQEWKKNNTFGATAFTSYGAFWLSLVAIWLIPNTSMGSAYKSDELSIGCYLLVWGIYSFFMFIGSLKHNMTSRIVFASVTLLFFLLAIGDLTGNVMIKKVAGFEGIFCGLSAFYSAVAQILNNEYGKKVLPLG